LILTAFIQVLQVKEKIEKEKGWEASQQKLIYSGEAFLVARHLAGRSG
jgi:hypothetical protein